jgi:hypothetical protein
MLEAKMIQKENAIRNLKGERGIEVNLPEHEFFRKKHFSV